MRELSALREGWPEIQELETRLPQSLTIQESVQQWLALQQAFEPQLQETAALFAAERRAALAVLQSRLQRLSDWQAAHGKSVSIDPGDPKPAA